MNLLLMDIRVNFLPAFLRINLYKVRLVLVGEINKDENFLIDQYFHQNLPRQELQRHQNERKDLIFTRDTQKNVKSTGNQGDGDEWRSQRGQSRIKSKQKVILNKVSQILLNFTILFSLFAGMLLFGPKLYYRFVSHQTNSIEAKEEGSPLGGDFADGTEEPQKEEFYVPEVNPNLPEGNWLSIPRIGVRTELKEDLTSEEALETGLWLVSDYAMPGDRELPMIVAGHRYGWDWWWKDDYWRYNSFYLLTDLEPGDIVEAISGQRKWVYEIYAGEEGTEITDYSANLILYTCKFLNSPIRHFRYARLIDPTKDSQVGGKV